ncbi:MAG: hypothetical protein P8Y07_14170, partial [Gemmatimonadales bacterium]
MRSVKTMRALCFVAGVAAVAGCDLTGSTPLFEPLGPEATGVTFVNELPEDPEFNIINYLNYYN